jgi:GGDEF domain-containing protein
MISIRNSVTELENCHQEREVVLECYLTAIRNVAAYAIDLDEETSATHRQYLTSLADDVTSGTQAVLVDSRATLRGLLRGYRDKAVEYLNGLREELAGTARALEEILDSLSQSEGDHEAKVRSAIVLLRDIAGSPEGKAVRDLVESAAGAIEQSVEQIRKQHQLTISQMQVEIRMLHKRIDAMETSASLDLLTQLYDRQEIEGRIRGASSGTCLLLAKAAGIRTAEVHYKEDVASELTAAFTKRLRNCLPPTAAIGRWSREEFVAVLNMPKREATTAARWISEHLTGPYACLLNGKTVRPSLQVHVAVVESEGNTPDRLMERVKAFLTGD